MISCLIPHFLLPYEYIHVKSYCKYKAWRREDYITQTYQQNYQLIHYECMRLIMCWVSTFLGMICCLFSKFNKNFTTRLRPLVTLCSSFCAHSNALSKHWGLPFIDAERGDIYKESSALKRHYAKFFIRKILRLKV